MINSGKFIISLDFELLWGVRDKRDVASYGDHILGVYAVLPRMLELFRKYDIKVTFASVGMLFADGAETLDQYLPPTLPCYSDKIFSPYGQYLEQLKLDEALAPYHFPGSLIELIQAYPEHEISSHTFSHYYTLEEGQTLEQFEADLNAAIRIAKDQGIELESLVFPRNQYSFEHLALASKLGFRSFRGNEKAWFYQVGPDAENSLLKRAFKLLDSYLNISGHNTTKLSQIGSSLPYNIPSSRFLRPYSARLKPFEGLRLKRIKKSMQYAAQQGEVFHLWWHPHNFGVNQDANLNFLEDILKHCVSLNKRYGFESLTMSDLSNHLDKKSNFE